MNNSNKIALSQTALGIINENYKRLMRNHHMLNGVLTAPPHNKIHPDYRSEFLSSSCGRITLTPVKQLMDMVEKWAFEGVVPGDKQLENCSKQLDGLKTNTLFMWEAVGIGSKEGAGNMTLRDSYGRANTMACLADKMVSPFTHLLAVNSSGEQAVLRGMIKGVQELRPKNVVSIFSQDFRQ